LACIISWTLHPEKKKRDTIDADLVVSLTLPVVAVFYLLSQISRLSQQNESHSQIIGTSDSRQAMADAIEAPLVIIEAFMNIAAIMFMIAARFIAIRRAFIIGIAGLLCFAADWYVNTSSVKSTGLSRLFSRNFVADSAIALVAMTTVLGLLLLTTLAIASFFFYDRHREHKRRLRQLESETRHLEQQLEAQEDSWTVREHLLSSRMEHFSRETLKDSRAMRSITFSSLLFLPGTFITTFFSIGVVNPSPSSPKPISHLSSAHSPHQHSAPSVTEWFFPRSQSSLRDLDQKAALLGGLTALAFSIYSTLAIWIKDWLKAQRRERELREQENIRLRRLVLVGQGRFI
jgi:hypothetical protein